MSGLGPIEIDMILDLFEGSRGKEYVLEFSNRTFSTFMREVAAVDIDAPWYQATELRTGGTSRASKGERLRAFLASAPEPTVAKVLKGL